MNLLNAPFSLSVFIKLWTTMNRVGLVVALAIKRSIYLNENSWTRAVASTCSMTNKVEFYCDKRNDDSSLLSFWFEWGNKFHSRHFPNAIRVILSPRSCYLLSVLEKLTRMKIHFEKWCLELNKFWSSVCKQRAELLSDLKNLSSQAIISVHK